MSRLTLDKTLKARLIMAPWLGQRPSARFHGCFLRVNRHLLVGAIFAKGPESACAGRVDARSP